jgi:hypothetical protein
MLRGPKGSAMVLLFVILGWSDAIEPARRRMLLLSLAGDESVFAAAAGNS